MTKPFRSTITTLTDLNEDGYKLYANCLSMDCGRGVPLDLDMLIERYGADYVFINETRIAAACRCSCGHRGAKVTINPGVRVWGSEKRSVR